MHTIESPSSNAIASARALARVAECVLRGGEGLISSECLIDAQGAPKKAFDAVAQVDTHFTKGGFNVFQGSDWSPASHGFIGWGGAGGSAIAWHPKEDLALSYTMTGMGPLLWSVLGFGDQRCLRLVEASRACAASATDQSLINWKQKKSGLIANPK